MNNIIPNVLRTQLRPASPILESKNSFRQLFNCCSEQEISSDSIQHSIFIITQYLVQWPKNFMSSGRDSRKFKVQLEGMQTYIPRDSTDNKALFLTNFDNNHWPSGGQLSFPDSRRQISVGKQFDFTFETELILSNYFLYKDTVEDPHYSGLLLISQITEMAQVQMEIEEEYLILVNSHRLMCNMVPDSDQIRDVNTENPKRSLDEIKNDMINNSNILQPWEILGGHCIAEFQLNNNVLIDSMENSVKIKSKDNILDLLF